MCDEVLQVKNITKIFGATVALNDVSVSFKKGTVHSLVGRNGAGKSTLVNIVAGLYAQTSGEVYLDGEEITELSVQDRIAKGIRIVTQHASVIPHLSVAENIFMGLWPKDDKGLVDWDRMYELAQEELNDYGLDIDAKKQVRYLDPIDQRKINIVRAMYGGAKLIILDEPTTSLSSEDRDSLFSFVKDLTKQGVTFILITHYLEEVLRLSDEITVLRDGICFPGYKGGTVNEEKLANLIAGENVVLTQREITVDDDEEIVLDCKDLRGLNLNNVSVQVKKGEILGIVGFPASGAREFCRTLYGLNELVAGEITVNGEKVNISGPDDALRSGIVFIPNDRHLEGLVEMLSIRENISLPILKARLRENGLLLNLSKERRIAKEYFQKLNVKANSIEDKISSLSGGNQQKVVVSKVLASEPKVLILDEPTVGIDVKSREEILTTVNEMTEKGLSAIYLTNDFDELLRIADRLLFFDEGVIIAERKNEGLTPEDVIEIRDSVKEGVK